MSKAKRRVVAFVVGAPLLVLVLGIAAAYASRTPVEVGRVDGRLRPCPGTPNCVNSEDPGDGSIAPLAFEGDPDVAFAALIDFLGSEERAELLSVEMDYAHAVYSTPILGFADDVEVRLDREAKVIHIRSCSRVGRSDLGTNRARVESIRARWGQTSPTAESGYASRNSG